MLSKMFNIGKTPILYFAFPYKRIDPRLFQLLILASTRPRGQENPINASSSAAEHPGFKY